MAANHRQPGDDYEEMDIPFTSERSALGSLRTLAVAAANNHERNLAKYVLAWLRRLNRENRNLRKRLAEAEDSARAANMNVRALYGMTRTQPSSKHDRG